MFYRVFADLIVAGHLAFIVFVVFGGLLVLRWHRLALLHLPAAAWGVLIELQGWLCPLTAWENRLRTASGEAGYAGGFVDRYLVPVVYPPGLTRGHQIVLGLAVLALNACVYSWLLVRVLREPRRAGPP
jgi:hypothetical protein